MSIVTSKEGLSISSDRRIPSTIATQFPDNVNKPFWSFKETATPADDFFDCYASFKEMDCHEYFWDWRSRKLDELLIKKLITSYRKYFQKSQIGKNRFITFTVDGEENLEELGKLYVSIISSHDFAKKERLHAPPMFEVVHSAESADDLLKFANLYNESVSIATDKFGQDCHPKIISILPIHNFKQKDWYNSLNKYLADFSSTFRCNVEYLRPLIPRSRIANQAGFVGSVLATKRALSSYHAFGEITGIDIHPIVETSTLFFRGGLNPHTADDFVKTYPGTRSVTITPSYRFDYDIRKAQESINQLNKLLPRNKGVIYSKEETLKLKQIESIFVKKFRDAMRSMPDSEEMCKMYESKAGSREIPASMRKSFVLYSLGVPPELIGAGNALLEIITQGLAKDLERFYPNIKSDLIEASALLNKENLSFLSKTDKFWKDIAREIHLIQDYTDSSLGPSSPESFMHRNHTSNVFHKMNSGKKFGDDLLAAAKLRRCVG